MSARRIQNLDRVTNTYGKARRALLVGLVGVLACTTEDPVTLDFPSEGIDGKADVFGRALAGIPAPYEADSDLSAQEAELFSDHAARRQMAWDIIARTIDPVPLAGLAARTQTDEGVCEDTCEFANDGECDDGGEGSQYAVCGLGTDCSDCGERRGVEATRSDEEVEVDDPIPTVPRWQTWYGVDDFKRMFQQLYGDLSRTDRARRTPFTDEQIATAEELNANAVDRSRRWPLERFLQHVDRLGTCPEGMSEEECANQLQSNFSGATAGNVRITYSPETIRHLLRHYGDIIECMENLGGLSPEATPEDEANFSFCFSSEFPEDAVLIKAQWARADLEMDMPVFDTDADSLSALLGDTVTGTWPEAGNRRANPGPSEIQTIRLRNGNTFRLVGLHIMTKELRHWTWITMWWSDTPDEDFGSDRPDSIAELGASWANYKMCVVVDYEEQDGDPGAAFDADHPTLAAALRALPTETASWCSNPYIEHGRGNARTNCIGCHQHGGATVTNDRNGDGVLDPFDLDAVIQDEVQYPSNGRTEQREVFAADYLWSFGRVDNLGQVVLSEANRFDITDGREVQQRTERIISATGSAEGGAGVYAANCARCHGADGSGDFGPSLFDRVPMRDDETLVMRILQGIGPMPAWDERLNDTELADLFQYLREDFGAPLD